MIDDVDVRDAGAKGLGVFALRPFRRGEFTVIELNGVAAEPTHIYDPAVSLWSAYKSLYRHWSEAFRIGDTNRQLGHEPTPLRELVRAVYRHLTRSTAAVSRA